MDHRADSPNHKLGQCGVMSCLFRDLQSIRPLVQLGEKLYLVVKILSGACEEQALYNAPEWTLYE